MVQWAFSERSGVSGSIFEMFSGQKTKASKLKPSRRDHGLSPTRVYAAESARQRNSKLPISSGRSGGDIKRAISSLPPIQQHWVHYCYNPSASRKREAHEALGRLMWEEFRDRHSISGLHQTTLVVMMFMLRLQLEQARSYPGFNRWRATRPLQLEESISRSSWSETYRAHWLAMRLTIEHVDGSSLRNVFSRVTAKKS